MRRDGRQGRLQRGRLRLPTTPRGIALAVAACVMLVLVLRGLIAHSGFLPVYTVRAIAPPLALFVGGFFTHTIARYRMTVDVPGEFNPGGRALYLGLLMLVFTLLAWLALAQGLPSWVTSTFGERRSELGVVAQKIPAASGAGCSSLLGVSGTTLTTPVERCVPTELWKQVDVGDSLTIESVAGPLGMEILDVHR